MLPTQVKLPIPMDIPPTQNIGLLDESQPQVYSLLATPNSPATVKQHRRKKASKLDDTTPVMVNPHIARTPAGITFAGPHLHSTMMQESMPSFVSTRPIQSNTYPFRLYIGPGPYDANNNINHHQISSLSVPLNSSLSSQPQQNPTRSNEPLPAISANSMSQTNANLQFLEFSRLLNVRPNGRTTPTSSRPKKEYETPIGQLILTDQGSLLPSSHPSPSTPTSIIPPEKPKRKYSRRPHPPAPVEQKPIQPVSQYSMSYTQSTVPNSLPSVSTTNASLEEQKFSVDMTTTSNFVPLTPPASISSIKSPPTNTNSESSLIPTQQHLLPQTKNNIADVKQLSRQYFPNQGYNLARKAINDSPMNNFHRLLAAAQQPYYMFPSNSMSGNILPITYSSLLSGTVPATIPSMSIPTDIKKERKKRGGARKSKVVQAPIEEVLMDKQNMAYKPSTTEMQTTRKRKRKNSNTKDIRTKTQLRRITRRNRLAVLKFMVRKRKQQQQQQRISNTMLPEVKVEEKVIPEFVDVHVTKSEEMETNLAADIIAPSLKISFDASQQIESISLYYHRRHKPDITNESSLKSSTIADNRLGLLIEALEFIETMHGSSKLALPSVN